MNSSIVRVSGGGMPVPLESALRHLRALDSEEDMVVRYVKAATAAVEDYCGRALLNTVFDMFLPEWPSTTDPLELRRSPLSSITSLKYYPEDGSAQATLASPNYRANTARLPGALEFVSDVELPSLATRWDAVTVRFTAGYGTSPNDVPAELQIAVLILAHHWYDERKPAVLGSQVSEVPFSLQHLFWAFRVNNQLPIP